MAVSFLSYEVSDLCIGKPPLKPLPVTATVGEALASLKKCRESYLSLWTEGSTGRRACLGKISMVDIICYLCSEENLRSSFAVVLSSPLSAILEKKSESLVKHVERHSSVTEALDLILNGTQNLIVPIRAFGKKKLQSNASEFCSLVQEDFARFFLNSIGIFSSVSSLSVDSLGIIQRDVLAIPYHESALSALPLIKEAQIHQTAVAITTEDGKLIGEISPSVLSSFDETAAAAIAVLSAIELTAYLDFGGPSEEAVEIVKERLRKRGMYEMLELMEGEDESSSASSSSDEEAMSPRRTRHKEKHGSPGSRGSGTGVVAYPGSSLVAVLIQALAHRVSYVWVVEDDFELAGLVTLSSVLQIFRDLL